MRRAVFCAAQDTPNIPEEEDSKGGNDDGDHISSDSTKRDGKDREAPLFRLCYELPLSHLADEGKLLLPHCSPLSRNQFVNLLHLSVWFSPRLL